MEIWKDIKGYEGLYQISNRGKVKSLERYTNNKWGSFLLKERIRKTFTSPQGYLKIHLVNENGRKNLMISRLVAQAFISNPDEKPYVNHINGIKADNRVENLEWCTPSENTQHAYDTGLQINPRRRPVEISKEGKSYCFEHAQAASNFVGCSKDAVGQVARGIGKSIYGWSAKYI